LQGDSVGVATALSPATAGHFKFYLLSFIVGLGLNLTVHCHFGGRPLMSAMLHELLRYMKGFSEVWFARHDEVARWTLANSKC